MATGQGGILSALLLFAILFRLGLLQEPNYDGEYRRVNDLSLYACNASHISKFDYVLSGLTVGTSDAISNQSIVCMDQKHMCIHIRTGVMEIYRYMYLSVNWKFFIKL